MKRKTRALLAVAAVVVLCGADSAVEPTNDLPSPYKMVAPWGNLPEGRKWGALSAVDIDRDGSTVWVADRCGANPEAPPDASPFQYDSCAGSNLPAVLKFDASGKLLHSFGANMFILPHKVYVDRDRNVWVVDQRSANARERKQYSDIGNRGHAVFKFSPEGKLLMTIGKPGTAGDPPDALSEPTSILVAPNGDIFISEGHGSSSKPSPDQVMRISKFTKDGRFIRSFGKNGAGPGEFRTPHDMALDAKGRLFVADRGNNRVQILDQEGGFIAEWRQFGRPSGVYIRGDLIYVADSESNGTVSHPGWKRGIRVGSLKDGKVIYRIPDPLELKGTSAAEGLAVDASGNVYGAEVGPRQLVKHLRAGK